MKATILVVALLLLGAGVLVLLKSGPELGGRGRQAETRPVAQPAGENTGPAPTELHAEAPAEDEAEPARRAELERGDPALGQGALSANGPRGLRGSVHGPQGPLEGASVRLRTLERALSESKTRSDGSFTLPGPKSDVPVRLAASAPGFAPLEIELPAERGRSFLGTLRLDPSVPLEGRVLTKSGAPAADAEVELSTARSNLYVHHTTTDDKGRFAFRDAPSGRIRLVARHAQEGSDSQEFVHEGGIEVSLQLSERAALRLRLTDSSGKPVPDLPVTLMPTSAPQPVHQGRTDAEGRCRFDALEAELWDVRVVDPRYRPIVRSSLRATGEEVVIEVSAWPCVRGKVVVPGGGAPPPGTSVQVLPAGVRGDVARQGGGTRNEVDEDGLFRVCGLRPGQYQVRIEASGFAPTLSAPIEVRMEGDVEAGVLQLDAGGALELVLRGPHGAAEGARVELYPTLPQRQLLWADRLGREMQGAVADGGGKVRLEHLGPGQVWVIVRSADCVPASLGPYTIASGETTAPDAIVLERGARIRGLVSSTQGPVSGAMVFMTSAQEQGATVQASTDGAGRFESPPLPAGVWTVRARSFAEGTPNPSEPVEVAVPPGGEKEIELSL